MTPLLCPVWWAATFSSLSISKIFFEGDFSLIFSAVASPTIPVPIIVISYFNDVNFRAKLNQSSFICCWKIYFLHYQKVTPRVDQNIHSTPIVIF